MSKNFEQSKTAENLARAFAGECQDGARYQYVADMAEQQKMSYIATILKQLATNEMAHAKVFMDLLTKNANGVIESFKITADYPLQVGNLEQSLKFDEENERKQSVEVYPEFARIAKAEGFEDAYDAFMRVAQVESCHTNILHQLYTGLKNKTLYKKNVKMKWKCSNCGHESELTEAWKQCPLCGAPQGKVVIVIDQSPKGTVLPPSESYEALKRSTAAKAKKDAKTAGKKPAAKKSPTKNKK